MPDDAPRFAPDDPAPARPAAGRPADWRKDSPGAAGNRAVLIALTLFGLLAVAGVLIGIAVYWPGAKPAPRLVSVPVGQYGPAWPVNPWSRQDADLLAKCFPDRSTIAFDSQERTKFRELLSALA